MFTSISWQTYLTTLSGIVTIYYLGILLLFYRTEFIALFTGNLKTKEHRNETADFETDSVIGEVKNDEHYSSVSSEELQFHHETEIKQSENHLTPRPDEN
ncbi:MAG TPA: hypothetical protein VL125_04830 [Pelobium sp.]|nr:hypothetical protein [Pelobium sp.]